MFNNNLTLKECKRLISLVTNLNVRNRSFVIAMILWFFLGFFGVHRIYINKFFTGILMAFLMVLGLVTKIFLIGYVFCGIVWLWWIYDLFMLLIQTSKPKTFYRA
ncbi:MULTISPECIES: NINE protein [unclassified Commensalibacter]|uniref:NINE protein n=1 Tax=Commensalibacter TaxID=1079922 RepID=UPI000EFC61F7|nr:TM2 domain-containing protein [Commensalibacter melissae]MBH9969761.1 TM2 domain-containing protein [Commensalibacter sp. M0265]MBH9977343.1 TM2 domain-containing protein [Commensalibacter sp. M0266]MBH9992796.1 TM2 domain-containing protein [Commensalibacter sp. M0270]MBI0046519.1 TM2 domain-containing protein [Commensalibacter sp. M0267]MBI0055961.1 TM2 domain-containing protein [Commensalibacter sp. M0268]MBI0075072.1 TM2 domain-containing protein [Commensalibacter sp. M0357]MBI0084914